MRQTCILILGMHRSGTSALSGVLNILDVYLGSSLIGAMEQNAKGFYENVFLNRVNERLLSDVGSSWHDVFFNEKKLEKIEHLTELEEVLIHEFQFSQLFAIKDPRLAYLFPLYAKVLSDLGVEVKIIIPIRNPLEVADSLRARDGFSSEKGLLLWAYNFLLSEKHSRGFSRVFTQFDDLLKSPDTVINLIDNKLGLDISSKLEPKRELLDSFLTPSMKHQNISIDNFSDNVPKVVREIILRAPLLNDNDLSEEMDSLRKELFHNQALFYNSDIVSDLNSLHSVRQSVIVKDQALDCAMHEVNAKAQELAQAKQDLQDKDQELAQAKQDLQDKDQELAQAKQDLQDKDQELAQAKQDLQDKDQELAQAKQGLQAKDQELAQAKQDLQAKDQELAQIKQGLQMKDGELSLARQVLQGKENQIIEIEQSHQVKEQELNRTQQELLYIYRSRSWRITRLLRNLRRKLNK